MSYIRRRFTTIPQVNLYPLSCFHVGAKQSDVEFIRQHIQRIKNDPYGYWIYMGDGGECVTKLSKGDVFRQIYSPQVQMDILIKELEPIRQKGLFAIRGNHGGRIFKETGLSFDKNLALHMGIPYMGVDCYFNMIVNRIRYDLFVHHGVDSGVSLQTKVNKADSFTKFICVDALFTAHSHIGVELPPSALNYMDNVSRQVKTKLRHQYVCGSGYDSRTGYARDKGYPPLLPQFIMVEFTGKRSGKNYDREIPQQEYHRWHSDGQHRVSGAWIKGDPEEAFGVEE